MHNPETTDQLEAPSLPCPFCQGVELETGFVRCTSEVFYGYVECPCGTVRRIDRGSEQDAIAAWNTRASKDTSHGR